MTATTRAGGASTAQLIRLGVSLRWRLVRNRLRKGGLALFILVIALCAIGALSGFGIFALCRVLSDSAQRAVLIPTVTLVILGWTFAPLLTGGADETVDPTRLALLPFTRRQLLAVLAGGAACGPPTIAVFVALCGIIVGFAPAGLGAIIVVLAVPAMFLLGLGTARLVAALLARAQRSRRGRDIAVLMTAGLGVALWLATQAAGPALQSDRVNASGGTVLDVLAWLPPGWPARSVLAARDGELGEASLWLAATVALAVMALFGWSAMVDRLLRSSERVVGGRASAGAPLGTATTGFCAALAKELIYVWRSPFKRVQLILGVVMGGGFCMLQALNAGNDEPRVVFIGLASPVFALSGAFNLIGFDSGSMWLDHLTGGIRRDHLAARSLSWAPHVLVTPVVVTVVMAAVTGQWGVLPLALIASFGIALCGLAIGLVVSVKAPIPFQDGDNPFSWKASNSGGLVAGLYVFGGLIALAVVTAPFIVPMIIWYREWWAYLVAAVGIGFGVVLWRWALNWATRAVEGKTPSLIAKLSPRSVT
jgi:ABC-2 type transport system permease protein